ncbi:MAG: DNA replication/repair protein RecF [Chloroflexi bacterium]|nr:DNA replication/repair protein RecF [Chloroflexota bacterium]
MARLSLNGFRNHAKTILQLHPGLTVFRGANGHGKSNLLEAVYMLAIAKSPRTSVERELINWKLGESGGHVQVLGVGREGDETVQAQVDYDVAAPGTNSGTGMRKSLRLNGIVRSSSEFVGHLNVVFFEADDLEIVLGSPTTRRRYLDILISQSRPSYLKALQRFSKVVTQRNHLLKRVREGSADPDEMAFWDERLAYEGAGIIHQRHQVIRQLQDAAIPAHYELTGGHTLTLEYQPQLTGSGPGDSLPEPFTQSTIEAALERGLQEARRREIAQGLTVVGPHRDDLGILLNGQPAGSFASRGQARIIALALKVAEAGVVKSLTGRTPILALDDILSELDPGRRKLVLQQVSQYEQVLLTTAEDDAVAPEFMDGAALFSVSDGKVTPIA